MIAVLTQVLADDKQDAMSKLIDDAGPIAMAFVVALGVAIYFLWRSMRKQMARIDPSLTPGPDDIEQAKDRERIAEAQRRGEAAAADADEPTGA